MAKKTFKTMFNPSKTGKMSRPAGAGNFDNMDDFNIVKAVTITEGSIQNTPTEDKHIVNKEYVDDNGGLWELDGTTGCVQLKTAECIDFLDRFVYFDEDKKVGLIAVAGDLGIGLEPGKVLKMNTNKITGVVDPTADQDAATKKYVDDQLPVTHAATTGQTTDDHHAESHNIASHNDTTATGTELNTLTDNSIANTLHRHSELVASDGSPDPALSINTTGKATFATSLEIPASNLGTATGILYQNGDRFIHTTLPTNQAPTYRNVFIGEDSGSGSLTNAAAKHYGTGNIGCGYQTLSSLTSGFYNFCFGTDAGKALTTASSNIMVGHTAGKYTTTGSGNIFFGRDAGLRNNGTNNTAVGAYILKSAAIQTASYNTMIGSQNFRYLTRAAQNNVGIGANAGIYQEGDDNVMIGTGAGYGSSANSTTYKNTIIGTGAGYALQDGADENIMIGYGAGETTTTGSNNILIGFGVDATAAATDNYLSIGDIIIGNISTGAIDVTGDLTAGTIQADDGFTGTGAYTNFTIVGGIITAAS